jgi:hypothetical protein
MRTDDIDLSFGGRFLHHADLDAERSASETLHPTR